MSNFLTLSDVIDLCRAEALAGKLYPSDESDYRWFCREYSKTFHTPLHEVLKMDAEHVMLCVFEEGLDSKRLRKKEDADFIIEELRRLEDPDYDSNKAAEFEEFAEGIEEWDDARQAQGLPPPTNKKGAPKEEPKKDLPKSGFLNLDYLAKEEEGNKNNGFQDDYDPVLDSPGEPEDE
jgi:hypothetical protein